MPSITFAGESPAYRTARNYLLEREIALRRETEAVAALRRALPPGPRVTEDYVFDGLGVDGQPARVPLSSLWREGTDTLVIYHYMFPRHRADERAGAATGQTAALPLDAQPCPSCTALLDQLDPAVRHFEAAGGNFAVVARAPIEHLRTVARDRGWRHLRLLSAGDNGFKRAFHAEEADGQQMPMTTVFVRDAEGTIRLFWASELVYAPPDPNQDHRATGSLEPFWNLFDLSPRGRPDFNEQLDYPECACHRS